MVRATGSGFSTSATRGGKTRQLSLRPDQVPEVRQALDRDRQVKETFEAISELNQQLLRLDRDEGRQQEPEK